MLFWKLRNLKSLGGAVDPFKIMIRSKKPYFSITIFMIENKEIGAALLRVIEVIGPEKIENLDEDTVYFIINTLNQLNVDLIRNKLLLKVLPLKV